MLYHFFPCILIDNLDHLGHYLGWISFMLGRIFAILFIFIEDKFLILPAGLD